VTLIGVTKGVAVGQIQEAAALGLSDIGENRVQEAQRKRAVLPGGSLRWHFIGHLQRNKARDAVALFDLVHSVDGVALTEALDRQAVQRHRRLPVLLQVNVSGEAAKSGCRPEEVETLARAVQASAALTLSGLMTLAPWAPDPEAARPVFQALRQLRDRLQERLGLPALRLSMGMSQDFEVAIEEGADFIRVGTALFGEETR
jgi:pyridoxal phosphate enzyme (YggS family)